MSKKQANFATLAIHAGEEKDQNQSLAAPIYMTSTFTFDDIQQADDIFSFKRQAYVYTRGGNPTINLLERRVAALEGGAGGVAFASGMAAIISTLLSLLKGGDRILAHDNLYGSAFSAIKSLLPRFGIEADFVDMTDLANVKRALTPNTKVIYLETPTNPSVEIIDIAGLTAITHSSGAKVVVDNTFATPFWQRPLELGADIVLHSATKYLCGHGDALGGIVVAKEESYLPELKFGYMCELGGVISPFNAWLILRGIKTLGLRMQKHAENADAIVQFLLKHPKVSRVLYPGLESHRGHEVAKKQMQGFGGIVSFELHGDENVARKCVESMEMAKIAVSLGDAETLIEIPALMTHRSYTDEDLKRCRFSKKTIRISAGLEDQRDIIADLEQALE